MKREASLSRDVKARARAIRDALGDKEYTRDEILAPVVEIIRNSPIDVEQMYVARAHKLLDDFDAADDARLAAQGEMFPGDAHVALGENRRIKRDRMKAEHAFRRKLLIDEQHSAQHEAWKQESRHLADFLPDLAANPSLTIGDIKKGRGGPALAAE